MVCSKVTLLPMCLESFKFKDGINIVIDLNVPRFIVNNVCPECTRIRFVRHLYIQGVDNNNMNKRQNNMNARHLRNINLLTGSWASVCF